MAVVDQIATMYSRRRRHRPPGNPRQAESSWKNWGKSLFQTIRFPLKCGSTANFVLNQWFGFTVPKVFGHRRFVRQWLRNACQALLHQTSSWFSRQDDMFFTMAILSIMVVLIWYYLPQHTILVVYHLSRCYKAFHYIGRWHIST